MYKPASMYFTQNSPAGPESPSSPPPLPPQLCLQERGGGGAMDQISIQIWQSFVTIRWVATGGGGRGGGDPLERRSRVGGGRGGPTLGALLACCSYYALVIRNSLKDWQSKKREQPFTIQWDINLTGISKVMAAGIAYNRVRTLCSSFDHHSWLIST